MAVVGGVVVGLGVGTGWSVGRLVVWVLTACLYHSHGLAPCIHPVSSCSQWQWGVLVGMGVGALSLWLLHWHPLVSACLLDASAGLPLFLIIHPLHRLCSAPSSRSVPSCCPWPCPAGPIVASFPSLLFSWGCCGGGGHCHCHLLPVAVSHTPS